MLKRGTFDTAGKRKVRELLKNFVTANLHGRKWSVVCMPGHECHEIFQIYDDIGVPRNGIVAVEKDPIAAEMIRKACPDITVWEGDLLEFLKKTDKEFHLAHLDFCGGLSPYVTECLEVVSTKLASRAVIALQVYGQRERSDQGIYQTYLCQHTAMLTANKNFLMDDLGEEQTIINKSDLLERRGDFVTHALFANSLFRGKYLNHRQHIWCSQQTPQFIKRAENVAIKLLKDNLDRGKKNVCIYFRILGEMPETECINFLKYEALDRAIKNILYTDLSVKENVMPYSEQVRLFNHAYLHDIETLEPMNSCIALERYTYTSGHANMFVDFAAFEQWTPGLLFTALKTTGEKINWTAQNNKEFKRLIKNLQSYRQYRYKCPTWDSVDRTVIEVPKEDINIPAPSIKEVIKKYLSNEIQKTKEEKQKIRKDVVSQIANIRKKAKEEIKRIRENASSRIKTLQADLDNHIKTILGSSVSRRKAKRTVADTVKASIIQTILSLENGFSSHEIAAQIGVSTEVVAAMRAWVTMYRKNGLSNEEILAKYGVEMSEK